jgi:enterochelin esterase family protein
VYLLLTIILFCFLAHADAVNGQTTAASGRPARPIPPTRDPETPGYVRAQELPDGANPPANVDGNFILGPTHTPAPELTPGNDTPRGTVVSFTMESKDSAIYPGIARDPNTFGTPDPKDAAKMIVTTSHPCAVHTPGNRLRTQAIRFRDGRAFHCRSGRT